MDKYAEMKEKIVRGVQECLGDDYVVELTTVEKTNVTRTGLTIRSIDSNLAPTIYLEDWFQRLEKGDSLTSVINQIAEFALRESKKSINVTDLLSWEKQKENVRLKVINFELNKDGLLKNTPYVAFLDLAVIFYLDLEKTFPDATITIHHEQLKMWGITVEELYEVAKENSLKYQKITISSMLDVLLGMVGEDKAEELLEAGSRLDDDGMYVISTSDKRFGAMAMLQTKVLEDFSRKIHSSFWIIPSSIHELIAIPDTIGMNQDYLNQMIQEVNANELSADEVLNSHAYYFNSKTCAITF